MANRTPRGKRPVRKNRTTPPTPKSKAPAKKARPKKPYARNHHRHQPIQGGDAKTETPAFDEDIDCGAATRGHRWSRDPAVYAGGMPDRRQSLGRRASDKAPPESFRLLREAPRPRDQNG